MAFGRAVLAAILAGVIAGCGASAASSPPSNGTPTDVTDAATARPTTTPIMSPAPTNSQQSLSPSSNPQPAPMPTPDPVPPKPAGVKFAMQVLESDDGSVADITQTVTWRTPRSEGIEIRVYGVTECIARPDDPTPDTSGPCLVIGTPLPLSVRTLLGTAPASDGIVSWSWTEETGCDIGLANDPDGPVYHAVVLAAYNGSGNSIFAIAEPGLWWEPGPDDIVC